MSQQTIRVNPDLPPMVVAAWLPTKPPRPCPEVLTADEAILYLRLDTSHGKDKKKALLRYRELGLLRGVRIGGRVHYRIEDLRDFVAIKAKEGV